MQSVGPILIALAAQKEPSVPSHPYTIPNSQRASSDMRSGDQTGS